MPPPSMLVGNELVTCKSHAVQRMAKFCVPSAVYNADRVVVAYTYACHVASVCSGGGRGVGGGHALVPSSVAAAAEGEGLGPSSSDPRISDDARAQLEGSAYRAQVAASGATTTPTARGPSRYYDISGATRNISAEQKPKKVCWSCGMDNHEKPQCKNQLCKRCHGLVSNGQDTNSYYGSATSSYYNNSNANHVCTEVPASPFVLLAPLTEDELKFTRCVACLEYGHLDCGIGRAATAAVAAEALAASSSGHHRNHRRRDDDDDDADVPEKKTISCCHCGESGHHGFDCHQQQYPDRWVQCVTAVGRRYGLEVPSSSSSQHQHTASRLSANAAPYQSTNQRQYAAGGSSGNATTTANRSSGPQRRGRDDNDDDDEDAYRWSKQQQQQQQYSARNNSSSNGNNNYNNNSSRGNNNASYSSYNNTPASYNQRRGDDHYEQRNSSSYNTNSNNGGRYQQQQQQQYGSRTSYVQQQQHSSQPRQLVDLTVRGGQDAYSTYNNRAPQQQQQQQQQQQSSSSYIVPVAPAGNNRRQQQGGSYQQQLSGGNYSSHNNYQQQQQPQRPQQQPQQRRGGNNNKRRYADSDSDDGGMQF